MRAKEPAVKLKSVSKRFRIFHESPLTLQKVLYNALRGRKQYQDIWALEHVDFTLFASETVGLIGPNASGKTTLLRIIAGIYTPTSGIVSVKGTIAASLELGANFCLEFTGIENIYLYAAVFGLKRARIKDRIPAIAEFSELEDFMDVPLRQYSLGMRMRLAFALAVHIEPDILLIDEMLAVGDIAFKEKCFSKIEALKRQGRTLLLVSHTMSELLRLCDKAVLLDRGRIVKQGTAKDVIAYYQDAYKG